MKKYFYSMLAAGMLLATSCSEDELVDVTKGEGEKVTFKVELPGTESRAIDAEGNEIGSGKYATKLIYAMYEEGKDDVLITNFVKDSNGDKQFEVTVPMAKDIKYDLLFMAYNPENCAFEINNSNPRANNLKALKLKPELTANTEQYDAFVGQCESQGITTTGKTEVLLYRPFAQVNVGTTPQDLRDIHTLKSEVVTSDFKIYDAPNTLNILTNEVSGSETRSYGVADILTKYGETQYPNYEVIPEVKTTDNGDYYCLAMSYVLASKNSPTTHDADFRFYRADGKQVSSIDVLSMPIQANYRTNILGTILTQDEQFEIIIQPFEDEYHTAEPAKKVVANQEDLQKVINEANEPTVIELGGNITFDNVGSKAISRTTTSSINIPSDKEITLDLNGYTMSGTCNAKQAHLIMVENGAILTIKDTSEEGTGKITYAGSDSTGWAIDVEGELNLYSGTIELTGTWSIGFAVDVRPNAWGTAYTEPTIFHMYGGKLTSSDGAVRVASSSSDNYTNVSANFIMDGGEIDALFDGLFIQQSNAAYDILTATINGGIVDGEKYPIRLYGPTATSIVENSKIATTLNINGGTILGGTTANESTNWLVKNVLCVGGDMTNEDLKFTEININKGTYSDLRAMNYLGTNADVKIQLKENVTLNEAVTIPSKAAAKVELDLNGQTITGTDNSTGHFGLITNNPGSILNIINTATNEGKITLTATNNRGWNAYSSVISNQRATLTVGEGVVIEHLGGTDMAYGIDNLTNTGSAAAITTIDGGTIKSTYRAIRQFLNSTSSGVKNELYVNGGTIKGDNCSIWMQNANVGANPGRLVVKENAEVKGNIKVSDSGTTKDWPIEVSVAASALQENSEISVPLSWDVVEEDGILSIVYAGLSKVEDENRNISYYVSDANGLAKLNKMMANQTAGSSIKVFLDADIDFTGKTWTPVNSHADTKFTFSELNGQGHTISNLTINGQAMFTRFAGYGDVTIKDVTFDNATVNSTALNTSILTVQSYQNVLLDNVDVKNSSITGAYKVAPLIGTVYNESSSTITATLKNCDVENVTVKATSFDFCTAGMVAFVYEGNNDKIEFENCTVKDVKLMAKPNGYTSHAAIYVNDADTDDCFNEAEGVTVTNVTFTALD